MPRFGSFGRLLGLTAALAGLAVPARGSAPRADLLRLVPEDVGFCLVVSDLRAAAARDRASPWNKALRDSALIRSLQRDPEAKKLKALEETLRRRLDADFARLRDDIFGDAVVLAYRPGPPGKPDQDQGLVLLWARDPKLLGRLIDLLNEDVKDLHEQAYQGVTYFRRTDARGKTAYYYRAGPVLAFSPREEMIREVLTRARDQGTRPKGKGLPSVLEQLHRLGADRALLALWFNPRAFEAHVRRSADAARGPQAYAYKTFLRYWQALECAALTLSGNQELVVKFTVRADPDKLPEPGKRFFTEATRPSDVWSRFPARPLLAVAGRTDFVAFGQFVGDFLPPPARRAFMGWLNGGLGAGLGLDVGKDVVPYLGPDWGFCLSVPADKDVLVPLMTWALRVRPGPKKVAVDQAVVASLNSLAFLAILGHNQANPSAELRLKAEVQGKVEVKYVEGDKVLPAGFKPAFAFKDGYLLLAGSPEAIHSFAAGAAPVPTGDDVPLLRVSLREWSRFLKTRRERLSAAIAAKDQVTREQAGQRLGQILQVLDLFDRVELTQRTGDGQATWTLTVKTAGPGKK